MLRSEHGLSTRGPYGFGARSTTISPLGVRDGHGSPTFPTMGGMSPTATALGFLYPGFAAEDDYPLMAERVDADVTVELVNTSVGVDAHRVDDLLDLGGTERLLDGARELEGRGVDVVLWACTSGSFVFGWDGAEQQAREVGDALGVPASSTSFAFVNAAQSLDLKRVTVAATYPDDVAQLFAQFLGHVGIETVSVGAEDVLEAAEVGTFGKERVMEFVTAGDHPDAEAVLVPDTALHSAAWIDDLEDALDKPVLTANQVTMWEALRLADLPRTAKDLGRLFT